jgi:hypothetical protein
MMVIVESSMRSLTPSENLRANDLKPYKENTKGPYVTAYLKTDGIPSTFVIGDGREYNSEEEKYVNEPLKQNSTYIVFLRFFENQVNRIPHAFTTKDVFAFRLAEFEIQIIWPSWPIF